jgi:hypothetical protein
MIAIASPIPNRGQQSLQKWLIAGCKVEAKSAQHTPTLSLLPWLWKNSSLLLLGLPLINETE